MITHLLFSWILGGISAVFSLTPSWTAPTFDNPPSWIGYAQAFNNILPIGWLLVLILATIVMYGLLSLLDLAFKVYHQFWGSD